MDIRERGVARRARALISSALAVSIPALLLGACCCLNPGGGSCVDFEDLVENTEYPNGDTFTDSGVQMSLHDFQWVTSTWTSNGHAKVRGQQQAGGSGNDLRLNNVNVEFHFGTIPGLTLLFADYGGNENLNINGDHVSVGNLVSLDGTTQGGVDIAIDVTASSTSGQMGKMTLTGTIESFSIGGAELWIDNVCPE